MGNATPARPRVPDLFFSASRAPRGHDQDAGEFRVALDVAGAGRVTPLGTARLAARPAPVAGYLLLELWLTPGSEAAGWTWLRLGPLALASGTVAMMANGYNGWSDSPFLGRSGVLAGENCARQEPFGDHDLYRYAEAPGRFHSWAFTVAQVATGGGDFANRFYGSVSDERTQTVFEIDLTRQTLQIALEVTGLTMAAGRALRLGAWLLPEVSATLGDKGQQQQPSLGDVAWAWGEEVARQRGRPAAKVAAAPLRGYTSWYYRYRAIDEGWLERNLAALAAAGKAKTWQVFQVDDGYQELVGDWLGGRDGFPRGVAPLFQKVRAQGLVPGIWCAPFVTLGISELARAHPEWLLRDAAGELVLCGDFPHWGGKFYALDTEQAAVHEHLAGVLGKMFKEWGAAFLKADFLYAPARVPAGGLTRAERGVRAMTWLAELCAAYGVQLLTCGPVLAQAFATCDFARIGPDVLPAWEDASMAGTTSREKCSTRASVVNTVTRLLLSQTVFGIDPDVFILRANESQLRPDQRELLAQVNGLFGDLIFCSDLLSEYDDETLRLLAAIEETRDELAAQAPRLLKVGLTAAALAAGRSDEYTVATSAGTYVIDLARPSLRQSGPRID